MPSASRVTCDIWVSLVSAACQDQVFLGLGSNELDHIGFDMVATIIFILLSSCLRDSDLQFHFVVTCTS